MTADYRSDITPRPTPDPLDGPPAPRAVWLQWIEPLLAAVLFGTALWILIRELRTVDPADIASATAALRMFGFDFCC